MKKTEGRLRRAKKTRSTIHRLGAIRLSVHRTNVHMYAQIIDHKGDVLAAASTLTKDFKAQYKAGQNKCVAASLVGQQVALKAIEHGIKKVAFDRSGFLYHGRVKALADAAREAGLEF